MQPTVFKDVDAFLAEMLEAKPMIEEVRTLAQQRADGNMVKEAEKLLTLFANDCQVLRELARRIQKPDGSIHMSFTQDAWNFLRANGIR